MSTPTPPTEVEETKKKHVIVRLRSGERMIASILAIALLGFYGGPFLFQATLNRRPPADLVRSLAMQGLPWNLRQGEMYDISSVETAFSRGSSVDFGDTLLASGVWLVDAKVHLRPKSDFFRPDDFGARARSSGDDATAYTQAVQIAKRFDSNARLPAVVDVQPLYARIPSSENVANVKFEVAREGPSWRGLSPGACLSAWESMTSGSRGWAQTWRTTALPAIAVPKATERYLTRSDLPKTALIADDPITQQAIQRYVESRRAFVAAVQSQLSAQNSAQFERSARKMLADQTQERLAPHGACMLSAVRFDLPGEGVTQSGKDSIEASVQVTATEDIMASATIAEATGNRSQDEIEKFDAARTAAQSYLASSVAPPVEPRFFKISAAKGTVRDVTATIDIETHDHFWTITAIRWGSSDPFSAGPSAIAASAITSPDIVVDTTSSDATGRIDSYLANRARFVSAVDAKLHELESRWGTDRTTWETKRSAEAAQRDRAVAIIERGIAAVGGRDAIRRFDSYRAVYRVRGSSQTSNFNGTTTVYFVPPDKLRIDQEIYMQPKSLKLFGLSVTAEVNPGRPQRSTLCLTGNSGWQVAGTILGSAAEPLPDPAKEVLQNIVYNQTCEALYPLLGLEYTLLPLPNDPSTPRDSVGLRVSREGKRDITLYFDEARGYLVGLDWTSVDAAGRISTTKERYAQYRNISGVLLPTFSREIEENQAGSTSTLESIQPLTQYEQGVFQQR